MAIPDFLYSGLTERFFEGTIDTMERGRDQTLRGILSACVVVAGIVVAGLPAWADRIHLTNGQMVEGIVIRNADAQVLLQIAWEGYVVLDRASIAEIVPSSERERERLLTQWKEEHQAFLDREEQSRRFEAEQRAKGLILYEGQWMSREELAAIKAKAVDEEARRKLEENLKKERLAHKREEEERKAREEELKVLSERLRTMQEEQLRLQQEVTALRCALARPRLPVAFPDFVRDEHGNLLRVQPHDGHLFMATPDGTHADLQLHDGHLSFTDQHGLHHDVEQTAR